MLKIGTLGYLHTANSLVISPETLGHFLDSNFGIFGLQQISWFEFELSKPNLSISKQLEEIFDQIFEFSTQFYPSDPIFIIFAQLSPNLEQIHSKFSENSFMAHFSGKAQGGKMREMNFCCTKFLQSNTSDQIPFL